MSSKQTYLSAKSVEDYISSVKHRAETLVKTVLPDRLQALNEIINSTVFKVEVSTLKSEINIPIPPAKTSLGQHTTKAVTADAIHEETVNGKKRKLEENDDETVTIDKSKILKTQHGQRIHLSNCGPVHFNEKIVHLINIGKPVVRQLAKDANLLKMWITFLIPEMEAGNNFGVEIQEAILTEVQIIEAEASAYGDQVGRYFKQRGDALSEITKFPMLTDYRKLVEEIDEAQFFRVQNVFSDVRDHYATLYDLTNKNMAKLVQPRNCNATNLY